MRLNGASSRLQIYDSRERAVVSAADGLLRAGAALAGRFRPRRRPGSPARILLLRLERIGDLVMALPAIADVRALAPAAVIDLVVGSWNRELAGAIAAVSSVRVLDARWLAREGGGVGVSCAAQGGERMAPGPLRPRDQFRTGYPHEPAARCVWFRVDGGIFERWRRSTSRQRHSVRCERAHDRQCPASGRGCARQRGNRGAGGSTLRIPESSEAVAARRLAGFPGPLVGLHVSGGRAIKQWSPERFAEVARRLITAAGQRSS